MKRKRLQFSLRTLLIAPIVALAGMWLFGRIETSGKAHSKRAYVFWMPRVRSVNSIAFAREPGHRFVCINWRPQTLAPTALVFHDDGTVEWQHCRYVNGKLHRRLW